MPEPADKALLRAVGLERQDKAVAFLDAAVGADLVVALDHNFVECAAEQPLLWVCQELCQGFLVCRERVAAHAWLSLHSLAIRPSSSC